jgi:hypothetical protein
MQQDVRPAPDEPGQQERQLQVAAGERDLPAGRRGPVT